jgi:hypothetical protein
MMRNIAIADQRRLGWDELERAVGMTILPLFDRFQGFIRLFSEVDRVVTHWVCQFYATVWVNPHRQLIQLMVNEHMTRIYLGEMRRHLRVVASDRKLQQIVYAIVDPL